MSGEQLNVLETLADGLVRHEFPVTTLISAAEVWRSIRKSSHSVRARNPARCAPNRLAAVRGLATTPQTLYRATERVPGLLERSLIRAVGRKGEHQLMMPHQRADIVPPNPPAGMATRKEKQSRPQL